MIWKKRLKCKYLSSEEQFDPC